MFSVIFPGQGSQVIGMGKEFFDNYDLVKKLFNEADEVLGFSLTKTIFEGPKDELDLTILAKFISVLERIEDGEIDQHEGSYLVGKLLKELYIDSALKKSEALDEKNAKLDKQKEAEIIKPKHKISWKEFKISQES